MAPSQGKTSTTVRGRLGAPGAQDPPPSGPLTARPRRRTLLAGVAALGTVAAAGACSRVPTGDALSGGSLLERLREQGTVKLGIAGEKPFGYIDMQGDLTGEAPEIAKVIFKRLGVAKVQPVPTEFGSLIPGLNSQQLDVISAGMFITPERCAQVLFADPEYSAQDAMIVRKGNPKKLRTYEDVKKSGARLASGTGYGEIAYAVDAGIPREDIEIYPDQLAGLLAVEQGRVDAFAATSIGTRIAVRQSRSGRVEMTEPFRPTLKGEPQYNAGAFAFRPGETRLRDAFNAELHKMKKSGELLRLMRPFAFTETEMTDLTAKELCR